ncbi:MAG: adenosylmethionine--8-amino-7-oxononanoate transaminase [Candidatus Cloacimonadota bacterium]|nr:MAG: adenosylmethionine--8-amino-7-oxononanoate transaminase [Candidatus Cloacimonadota bacterium]PIE80641.1 MAG: adenosylmethionine--8-amino-7-oxononanoate transaminase [Candidatus Delongbacteria bacterium]
MDKEFDRKYIWHPYTSLKNPLKVYGVKRCYKNRIVLDDKRELIDGMSSWWAAIHGYNNSYINKSLKSQADKFSHVMFGGFTHETAIDLCKSIKNIMPNDLNYIFLADSGSVSVEVALKMAIQYQYSKGKSRSNFLTFRNGYHGDTYHAMSVCDPVTGMHTIFNKTLPSQTFVEKPKCKFDMEWKDSYFTKVEDEITKNRDNLAAVIVEPIVQGAGGMWIYHPNYLNRLREICSKFDILLIFDEIATGFGRTGKMFAMDHTTILPDIVTIGKGLTGGYMTMGAVVANEKVKSTISESSNPIMMHGPTFMGNPLACSCAIASLDLVVKYNLDNLSNRFKTIFNSTFKGVETNENVRDVRSLGMIGVIEMKRDVDMERIQKEFVDRGVWLRPFGKLIYMMPPYITPEDDLKKLCMATREVIENSFY